MKKEKNYQYYNNFRLRTDANTNAAHKFRTFYQLYKAETEDSFESYDVINIIKCVESIEKYFFYNPLCKSQP